MNIIKSYQTLFVARIAGFADVDPQRLLPQCTVGYLHAEHLVDLLVLRQTATCSEEAAGGLHAGQDHHTHVPAAHTHTQVRGTGSMKTKC